MTDEPTTDRRTVLAAAGSAGAAVSLGGETVVAERDETQPTVSHDFEIVNQTPIAQEVHIGLTTPAGETLSFDASLAPNRRDVEGDGHRWKRATLPVAAGRLDVSVETGEGATKMQTVALAPRGDREHEALSVAVTRRGVMAGRVQR